MNKRQREKLKQDKAITYQEAWNKIAEYMGIYPALSYHVSPWSNEEENKYTLRCFNNGEEVELFVANKGRK